jgi:UPF0271 protein
MARTIERAKELNVAVGAHPGYPDLWGFGRREMTFTPSEIEQFVAYQVGAAMGVSAYAGHPISYVKPHGALANLSQADETVARAVLKGIASVDSNLVILTFSVGHAIRVAQEMGLKVCAEIFADRAYTSEGLLVSRKLPGAVLHDPEAIAQRVVNMVKNNEITAVDGTILPTDIGSICVHGDTPGAIEMAMAVQKGLAEAGIEIKPFAGAQNDSKNR